MTGMKTFPYNARRGKLRKTEAFENNFSVCPKVNNITSCQLIALCCILISVNNHIVVMVHWQHTHEHTDRAWKPICYRLVVSEQAEMRSPPVCTKSTCFIIPVALACLHTHTNTHTRSLSLLKVNRNSVVWLYTSLTACFCFCLYVTKGQSAVAGVC